MVRQATVLVGGVFFGEGPRWHEGKLWFSDFYAHAVKTVTIDGVMEEVLTVPNQPSGLGWLPDGRMLVVSMLDRKVLRLEPEGLVEHADLNGVAAFHCNDMVVDGRGRAYVGNFGFDNAAWAAANPPGSAGAAAPTPNAKLARVDPDGSVHVAAEDIAFPNGTVITPDGRTLIIAETRGRRLSAFDIDTDGWLSGRRVWAETGAAFPDGICLDAEGAIWVANARAPECLRIAEGGEVLDRVVTSQNAFACALGGEDRRTLFIPTAPTSGADAALAAKGCIEVARVDVAGA